MQIANVKNPPSTVSTAYFSLLVFFFCILVTTGSSVPLAGRGDPLLNPLLSGGRQQTFSSMRVGELPSRLDVGLAMVINADNPGGYSLRIDDRDGRFTTTGRFLVVEYTKSFQLEFASGGVVAFAFNLGGLDRDMMVELYDKGERLMESFRVRAFEPDGNRGVYIGAFSPTAPVHRAVFTFDGVNDALCIDNLTVMGLKLPNTPPFHGLLFAAADSPPPVSVPESGWTVGLLAAALAGVAGLKRRLR